VLLCFMLMLFCMGNVVLLTPSYPESMYAILYGCALRDAATNVRTAHPCQLGTAKMHACTGTTCMRTNRWQLSTVTFTSRSVTVPATCPMLQVQESGKEIPRPCCIARPPPGG
jgi:hypothetical protein